MYIITILRKKLLMFFLIQKHQKKIQILEERLKRQEDMFEARISHEEKEKKSKVCVVM